MLHEKRTWCVTSAESPEWLARALTKGAWTRCTGFSLGEYLFLNDSTSEGWASEWAVVRKAAAEITLFIQVESITFGWLTDEQALKVICDALAGRLNGSKCELKVQPRLEAPGQHRRCPLCA